MYTGTCMGFSQEFLGWAHKYSYCSALLEAHPSDHWMFSDAPPLTERSSIICSVLN